MNPLKKKKLESLLPLAIVLAASTSPAMHGAPGPAQTAVQPSEPDATASPVKEAILAAARKLADHAGYEWRTELRSEGGGAFARGGTTRGRIEKDGYIWLVAIGSDAAIELARKGDHVAVVLDGSWMTLEQAAERAPRDRGPRGGGLDRESIAALKMPLAQIEELLEKAESFREDGARKIVEVRPEAVNELLSAGPFGGRGGPRRGPRGALEDPKGIATFTVEDGMLKGFVLELSGARETPVGKERRSGTVTTAFTAIGSAPGGIPADAQEILDALAAGRRPEVFVPEPGFRKLSSGRDLSGWRGRPGFWSVEGGAITGRTTLENRLSESTFLIALAGDKDLVVDDFELRLRYRIRADNDSGFADSGIQYRSRVLGDFVVGGYQADCDASRGLTGILRDEAGAAGGRGILAEIGELAAWSADGMKTTTGRLGSPDEIRAAIRPGDWNDYVIIAQGSRLQHFVNGVQTVGAVDEARGKRLSSGVLALELHAGEPMIVQFKDIRLKTLGTPDVAGGAAIKVAKDFAIELLYTVPRETQGSWVAMCLDPKGRLIVSDQNGALYRVTLPSASGESVRTEKVELDIGHAHGLLWAFDRLYVAVNEGSRPHGVYAVRDTDGDDRLDRVELLREVRAGGEHGLHSLVLSPDGKSIHVVIGNQSSLAEMASSRVPRVWSEDDLLPRLPTGFMDDSLAPQGYIARMDPDGKTWELIAMGFRNPFDAAFNTEGELFTYDADMEWDIGVPWYRPTRVNHVISGAEFGFRNGNGKWSDAYLDSFGAAVDIGPGSPTGVAFGYGAKFPAKYQEAFYIADWSFGKLRAVHLKPEGSSYTAEVEDFVGGQPFPITDFVVSPKDGAMYIAVGGRGAQSALYRVTYTGSESTAPAAPDGRLQDRRDLRRRLEAFHGRRDPAAVEAVWPYLGDTDRAIRHAARVALEWQDTAEWRSRALAEKDARKAIAALVALSRVSGLDAVHRKSDAPPPDPALRGDILRALGGFAWDGLGPADRVDLLRAYSLAFTRLGRPDDEARAGVIARLDPLFPSRSREQNALLARLLIHLEAPVAAAKVLAALREAHTQEEQIEYAIALRVLKTGWTLSFREEYFRWFVKAQAYRGGNTFASSLRRAKEGAVALLGADEKRALQPILDARSDVRSPLELLSSRRKVKEWTVDELLPVAENGMKGGRDFERGRRLYGEVACSACHRFANDGGSVGPDLSAVAGRFGLRDLLEAIVLPSKTISDQYEAVIILKKSGEVVTGRIANLSGSNVNVVENMLDPGAMTNVRRADIASIEPSQTSPMPEGLFDTLGAEEVQDLIAYLLSRGDPESAVYN